MKQTILLLFVIVFTTSALGQLANRLDKLDVNDLTAKKLNVVSTTSGSKPCPAMTQVQRDAIVSPVEGQCIYNSTAKTLNLYDGSAWVEVAGGGEGGIAKWEASKFYEVDDVVISGNEIYICIEEHTSGMSFDPSKFQILAQDLANSTGVLSMSKGGTDKALTPELGGIVYTDAGSMEVLSAGDSGKFLQSNGAAAPSWESVAIGDGSFTGLLSLGKGGTNKNLSAEDGAILYLDADSVEKLSPGTSGQILQSNGAGAPSFVNKSISAKSQSGSSVTLEEIQVSNNQLTQVDTNKHLIESGNKNILTNPSFEHSTISTGWVNGAGTLNHETTIEIDGLKAARVNLSSQTMSLSQDSTAYASQLADGVQMLAYARVKTSVSGVQVCPRQAGATVTSLCVDVQANNKWGLYKVPFISGATSNGIIVRSTGAVSGDVYVDDSFVGISNILDVKPVVSAWNDFTMNITATTTNPTKATTRVNDEARWRQVGDSIEIHYSYHHNNNAGASAGSGTYLFNLPPGFTINTAKMAAAPDSNTRGSVGFAAANGPGGGASGVIKIYSSTSLSMLVDYEDVLAISEVGSSNFGLGNASASYSFRAVVPVNELSGSTSTYSSLNKDTDWQACQFSTLAWQGLGTVTNNLRCKRQGSDLLIRGQVTVGTVSANQAQIPLPTWNGSQLIISNSQLVPTVQSAGRVLREAGVSNNDNVAIMEAGLSYLGIGQTDFNGGTAPTVRLNGNSIFLTGNVGTFENIRIPIEGWENSNIIIGSFNGLEKCTDSYECTDVFSAKATSAGVVSDENIDWITGNATVSTLTNETQYTYTLKSGLFTVAPNCSVGQHQSSATSVRRCLLNSTSSTQVIVSCADNQLPQQLAHQIICQKQGVDYIGKTAKAVASDQNVRSIGAVGVDIQSVSFGSGTNCGTSCSTSPCTICNQVGTKITSVSRTGAGIYRVNGIDGLKYSCTGSGITNGYIGLAHIRNNSSSSYAEIQSGNMSGSNADSAHNSLICIGVP